MGSRNRYSILNLNFSFLLALFLGSYAQNTLLQDTQVSNKVKVHSTLAINISRIESRLSRQIRESERRISHRLEHKIRLINHTASINHIDAILDHYYYELEETKKVNKEQATEIKHLKSKTSHQSHELNKLANSVDRLKKTVESLNGLVEELVEKKNSGNTGNHPEGSSAVPHIENEVDQGQVPETKTTTNVPFNPLFPTDCQYVYESGGMQYPGYYYIMIQPTLSREPFKVCCKMTNNSGWTLLQRRLDGETDFYKDWEAYKNGFGNLQSEFWLGNEHIYHITNQGNYKLRIEMKDWEDRQYWAEYAHFKVDNEDENYRLHVHGYKGNAGDSLTSQWQSHNAQPFSTYDRDNDDRYYDNCAEHYRGAWWFKSCFESNLNGVYYRKGSHNNYFVRNGVQWNTIHLHSSLQTVSIMIKPNEDLVEENDEQANDIA